jgi:transposase InsO family protein
MGVEADCRLSSAGSMGRRGNPYSNSKAQSFMKTLEVETVYLMEYEIVKDVTVDLPLLGLLIRSTMHAGPISRSATGARLVRGSSRWQTVKSAA